VLPRLIPWMLAQTAAFMEMKACPAGSAVLWGLQNCPGMSFPWSKEILAQGECVA